jgi:hypothetical protein
MSHQQRRDTNSEWDTVWAGISMTVNHSMNEEAVMVTNTSTNVTSRGCARAGTALAGLALCGVVSVGAADPAAAEPYTVVSPDGQGVQLLTGPDAEAPMFDNRLADNTAVKIICQAWSSDAVGPRGNHIFNKIFLPPLDEAHSPWIPDAYVHGTAPANQFTPGIPRCDTGTPPAVQQAIDWARGFLGHTEYVDECQRFVRAAYAAAGVDIGRAESAAAYAEAHRDQLQPGDTPPAGALVFWWATPNNQYGHVALSLGDGTAISTSERGDTTIHILNITDRNTTRPYAGWMTVA